MLNKLIAMLNENKGDLAINEFNDLGETTLHLANLLNMFATVGEADGKIYVDIEEYYPEEEQYYLVATKEYKTPKGAYNFIKKMLP